ncbi:MAG: hypothetical protein LC772_05680 [Chloroflexi bacterium]|nr:hypothetical protein [Chloroflexota bacterium]
MIVSPDGRWAALPSWTRSSVYPFSRLELVELRDRGADLVLPGCYEPAFSPDGRWLAFTRESASQDVELRVKDLRTGKQRVLYRDASGPCWIGDGHSLVAGNEDNEQGYVVLDASSGRVLHRFSPGVSSLQPIVSPDGRYVGICHKISRPQVGSGILDTASYEEVPVGCFIDGYNPALLQRWSPDGKRLLWDLTVPDPDNDGCNLGDTVVYSSLDGSRRRLFGRGGQAHFAPDSRHVLWIGGWSDASPRPGQLIWSALDGRPKVLLSDVTAFDLVPG